MSTIAFDLDDTLYDTDPIFRKALQKRGFNLKQSDRTKSRWEDCNIPGVTEELLDECFLELVNNGSFGDLPLRPKAKQVVDKCKALGHKVLIITARPQDLLEKDTLRALKRDNIPYDGLFFTSNKNKVADEQGIDILLDADPKHQFDLQKVILVDQPWNQNLEGNRLTDLEETFSFIPENKSLKQAILNLRKIASKELL